MMPTEKICVYVPVEEYRGLVRGQREAECLKAILAEKLRWFSSIPYEEVKLLCAMMGLRRDEDE